MSTHPASRFVNAIVVVRAEPGRRLNLNNHEFTNRRPECEPERRTLTGSTEIRHVLEREFLLHLPAGSGLDQRLQRLPA